MQKGLLESALMACLMHECSGRSMPHSQPIGSSISGGNDNHDLEGHRTK